MGILPVQLSVLYSTNPKNHNMTYRKHQPDDISVDLVEKGRKPGPLVCSYRPLSNNTVYPSCL